MLFHIKYIVFHRILILMPSWKIYLSQVYFYLISAHRIQYTQLLNLVSTSEKLGRNNKLSENNDMWTVVNFPEDIQDFQVRLLQEDDVDWPDQLNRVFFKPTDLISLHYTFSENNLKVFPKIWRRNVSKHYEIIVSPRQSWKGNCMYTLVLTPLLT